jgi:hypothetical protein
MNKIVIKIPVSFLIALLILAIISIESRSEMEKIYAVKELVGAIEANPVVLRQIPDELALSFPIPIYYFNRFLMAFMYFRKVGFPPARPKVYPPEYWVIIDPETKDIVELTTAKPEYIQITYLPNQPLGEHKLSLPLSVKEYLEKKAMLYDLYDCILPLYKTAKNSLAEDEKQAIHQFYNIFNLLSEKPLLPFYRALNPDFFSWLESYVK